MITNGQLPVCSKDTDDQGADDVATRLRERVLTSAWDVDPVNQARKIIKDFGAFAVMDPTRRSLTFGEFHQAATNYNFIGAQKGLENLFKRFDSEGTGRINLTYFAIKIVAGNHVLGTPELRTAFATARDTLTSSNLYGLAQFSSYLRDAAGSTAAARPPTAPAINTGRPSSARGATGGTGGPLFSRTSPAPSGTSLGATSTLALSGLRGQLGVITEPELRAAFASFGVTLREPQFAAICRELRRDPTNAAPPLNPHIATKAQPFSAQALGTTGTMAAAAAAATVDPLTVGLSVDDILLGLRGPLAKARRVLVDRAWAAINGASADSDRVAEASSDAVARAFGDRYEEIAGVLEYATRSAGTVTWDEFTALMRDVSAAFGDDEAGFAVYIAGFGVPTEVDPTAKLLRGTLRHTIAHALSTGRL